jgi:hypothetical protein
MIPVIYGVRMAALSGILRCIEKAFVQGVAWCRIPSFLFVVCPRDIFVFLMQHYR